MATKFLPGTTLAAFTLAAMSTLAKADVAPLSAPPVKVARTILIQQALGTVQQAQDMPTLARQEYPARNIVQGTPNNLDYLPNSCAQSSGSLCYDYRSGHAMYKPMRNLLPVIPGMTPHNLSLHRDRIVAEYTFK